MVEPSLTHCCIVRGDLPIGVIAAQLVHAAGESAGGPLPPGVRAVVLVVPDSAALLRVHDVLSDLGLAHRFVCESDPPWCGAPMTIGIAPIRRDDPRLRVATSRLPLFRSKDIET